MGQGPLPAPWRAAGLLPAPETPLTGMSLAGLPAARPRGPWTLPCFPRGCTRPSRAGCGARAWACSGCRGGPGGEGGLMEAKPPWGQCHGVKAMGSLLAPQGVDTEAQNRRKRHAGGYSAAEPGWVGGMRPPAPLPGGPQPRTGGSTAAPRRLPR